MFTWVVLPPTCSNNEGYSMSTKLSHLTNANFQFDQLSGSPAKLEGLANNFKSLYMFDAIAKVVEQVTVLRYHESFS